MRKCLQHIRQRIKAPRPLWSWPAPTKAILKRRAALERGLQAQIAHIKIQQFIGLETAWVRKLLRGMTEAQMLTWREENDPSKL